MSSSYLSLCLVAFAAGLIFGWVGAAAVAVFAAFRFVEGAGP